ncbi:D/L-glyceraldehyde reductase [Ascochyta rabiei]|uniref:D/L-glyceraldehyde reductase n=1 Tax=Didymella rabiei TaxID=5454 RepID=UPI00220C0DD2|nr:D/L-glyceraldehyde reductase [Ascochyta rabiei]UPX12231.1 D/L-glyceraldehyde reductase [Ascochyta rabiei]
MRYLMKSIPRSWLGLQTPRCTSFSSLKAYASFRMSSGKTATLNTGYKIPQLGYGTWQAGPGEVGNGVYEALKIGYRHLVSDPDDPWTLSSRPFTTSINSAAYTIC